MWNCHSGQARANNSGIPNECSQGLHETSKQLTISREPLRMPHNMFEYQSSSCARPSSGNSTKSARGFSSKINENCLLSLVQLVIVGVTLRKILKPTYHACQS